MMAKRDEKHEMMEEKIFDAALDLFCALGYKKTTLVEIASEANVSTRTLYKYFPSKESILRKFCEDNLDSLKDYARNLPEDLDLKEKVLRVMSTDFGMMFRLFDTSYILNTAKDEEGYLNKVQMENIFSAESIYAYLLRCEQVKKGVEPGPNLQICASIIMAIYRHCIDTYRMTNEDLFDEKALNRLFSIHIDIVWPGIYNAVIK